MSTSETLWACGTLSTSVRPDGNTVPAGRPPSLATMATLSRSCMVMYRGADVVVADMSVLQEEAGSAGEGDALDPVGPATRRGIADRRQGARFAVNGVEPQAF